MGTQTDVALPSTIRDVVWALHHRVGHVIDECRDGDDKVAECHVNQDEDENDTSSSDENGQDDDENEREESRSTERKGPEKAPIDSVSSSDSEPESQDPVGSGEELLPATDETGKSELKFEDAMRHLTESKPRDDSMFNWEALTESEEEGHSDEADNIVMRSKFIVENQDAWESWAL